VTSLQGRPAPASGIIAVLRLSNLDPAALRDLTLPATELCAEGIRLARVLAELMPDEPEAQGLLALLLLLHARSAARLTADGSLVRLAEQDRRLWDRGLIADGQAIVRACVQRGRPARTRSRPPSTLSIRLRPALTAPTGTSS
jgi:RNA polymerase sigma-70 factor (ECF subfamily)